MIFTLRMVEARLFVNDTICTAWQPSFYIGCAEMIYPVYYRFHSFLLSYLLSRKSVATEQHVNCGLTSLDPQTCN